MWLDEVLSVEITDFMSLKILVPVLPLMQISARFLSILSQ